MDWLSHPLVLASYTIAASIAIGFAHRLTRLFARVTSVEQTVKGTDAKVDGLADKVDSLSADLREHMAEEGRAVSRLEGMLSVLLRRENVHDGA